MYDVRCEVPGIQQVYSSKTAAAIIHQAIDDVLKK